MSETDLVAEENVVVLYQQSGDPSLMDELVHELAGLVRSVARAMSRNGAGAESEDAEQIAWIGMLKAIRSFNPELGTFRSWATALMRSELQHHLRDATWAIRVPRSDKRLALFVQALTAQLAQDRQCTPSDSDVAEAAGVSLSEVAHARAVLGARVFESGPVGAGTISNAVSADWIEPHSHEQPELRVEMLDLVTELPPLWRRILWMRFVEGLPQHHIGKLIGISQMSVSRIVSRSCTLLRRSWQRADNI